MQWTLFEAHKVCCRSHRGGRQDKHEGEKSVMECGTWTRTWVIRRWPDEAVIQKGEQKQRPRWERA